MFGELKLYDLNSENGISTLLIFLDKPFLPDALTNR